MGTPAIKTKFELDGEKEYKQALSEINSGLRVLNSEMKLTSAQFSDNADSVEALTAKGNVLERQVLSQKDKIEQLRAALKNSAQENGEASTKTNQWKVSLNNAEKELIDLEKQLKDNTAALDKTNQKQGEFGTGLDNTKNKTTGLGSALDGLCQKFGVNLPSGMTQSLNGMAGLSSGAMIAVGAFAALAAAVVAAETKLISMTKKSAATADEILTLSMTTGLATDTIQEFQYSSELLDVSFDTVQGGLTKLTNSMEDARNGSANAKDAFEKLGITVNDETTGQLRNAEEVFYECIDALGQVQSSTERDALAMDIMGKSAQDLNPLIIQGSGALKELSEEAHNTGYVMSTDMLKALGAVDDSYQRLQNTQDAVKNQLSAEFAPYLKTFYDDTTSFVKNLGDAVSQSGIVDAFGMLLETFGDIIAPADQLSDDTIPKLTQVLRPLAEILAGMADTVDFFSGLFTLDFAKIGKAFGFGYSYGNGNHTQTLKEKWQQTDVNYSTGKNGYGEYYANGKWYSNYDEYLRTEYNADENKNGTFEAWKNAKGYNASGIDNFPGGLTWVGENGPELVGLPQGSRIMSAQESRLTGGDTYNITIDAKSIQEFNDIVRISQNRRMTARMGGKK